MTTPQGMLLGARELGLAVEWRFGFLPPGQRAETTPGVVYLDVGGSLQPGVLDHHGEEKGDACASGLVLRHPALVYNHLLSEWLRRYEVGAIVAGTVWRPTLVTHLDPDFDSVVACHLVMRLIEYGGFPSWGGALAAYAREVDQGRCAIRAESDSGVHALHLGHLAVQNLKDARGRSLPAEQQLHRGLELIELGLRRIEEARGAGNPPRSPNDLLPGSPGATEWAADTRFQDVAALLDADRQSYESDRECARLIERVTLPASKARETLEVRALVLGRPPASILNKYWVRAEGAAMFVCPHGDRRTAGSAGVAASTQETVYPRVVVSVDPTVRIEGKKPTLHGLGFALERAEAARRRASSSGRDDRGGEPRFPDGYCDNADPWYDGRAFDYTIVDAPHSGTTLPYAEIVSLATQTRFWEIPVDWAAVYLVWTDPRMRFEALPARTLVPFTGMAPSLEQLYADSAEIDLQAEAPGVVALPTCTVTATLRRSPSGTCPPLRIVRIKTTPGATLEELVRLRDEVIRTAPSRPEYTLSRVVPNRLFAGQARFSALVASLADGELTPLTAAGAADEVILFNNRSVLFHGARAAATESPDADLEILLYVAFLNETLTAFSQRVSTLLPDDGRPDRLDTEPLRSDFLRFQTSYYQLEVSRRPRGRQLYEQLAAALDIKANYAEVQSELDRLAQLETRLAEDRQARADRVVQFVLYLVAVFGVVQTFLALWVLDATELRSLGLWGGVCGILLAAIATYALVDRHKR